MINPLSAKPGLLSNGISPGTTATPCALRDPSARPKKRGAELAGGTGALLARGRRALSEGGPAWAARLADHLLALDPAAPAHVMLKADALDALAEGMLTATGRNYALTVAQQLRAAMGRDAG
ncbi:MAG: hypothetical protein IKS68_08030 [Mailhella sp.]|nr:hypothetical protein [Mailhella sp.]